jgi:benzoyl-CoA reductase/2-hydroxyglutaryl-CoA dehydratase subunit BcrC/BadD/HgdB
MEPSKPGTGFQGEVSKKSLKSSALATQFQRQYYNRLKERVAQGEPFIWFNVGVPMEIMHAMDLPCLCHPNWSAIIAAKQMAGYYLNVVNERGYFRDLCRYCAVPMGYFLDHKPEKAPWGGLPTPSAFILDVADDPVMRIYELIAKDLNVPLYLWDHTMIDTPAEQGFWDSPGGIEAYSYQEPWRLDYAVKETEGLISFLETITGKSLSEAKLREVMERSNEQFDYIQKAMDLAALVPTPMGPGDHMANLLTTQFFRGHEFGLAQAKRIYEELKERVDRGEAAYDKEKIRLMYLWVPNWFTPGFMNHFEDKYGAVFAWIGYLPLITKQLIRRDLRDPLKALAARYVHYTEFGLPPWWQEINLSEAKRFKIDGAIYPIAESCKLLCGPLHMTVKAFKDAGIPTLEIRSDMVDVRDWDDAKMKAQVSSFIETLM